MYTFPLSNETVPRHEGIIAHGYKIYVNYHNFASLRWAAKNVKTKELLRFYLMLSGGPIPHSNNPTRSPLYKPSPHSLIPIAQVSEQTSSFALSQGKTFLSSRLTVVSNDNTIQELLIVSKQWETRTTCIHHPQ